MASLLDTAIALTPRSGEGLYSVDVNAEWNTPNQTPNGGYVLALLLAAVKAESSKPDLLTASVSFLKPIAPGPAIIAVSPLRRGRRVETYDVWIGRDGQDFVHGIVSTHDWDEAGSAQHTPHAAPDVARPDDGHDPMSQVPPGAIPILEKFDYRHPEVPGWMEGKPSGTTEAVFWIRARDSRPIDDILAGAMVDAYPPVTTEIGIIASATVQLTVHWRRRPTGGEWALSHTTTRHVIDGYHDEDVELWDEHGHLLVQSRQLALLS